MPGTKSESLGSLQRFNAALTANVGDYPRLMSPIELYSGAVQQLHQLTQEQAALVASKQDMTRQLQFAMAEAHRLATVLRLAIKHHYGIDSEKLVEFGMQPFRGRTRKVKETPPTPEAPAPAVDSSLAGS